MTDTSLPGEPIVIPIPNELDRIFGYRGDARYVGFSFTPMGDEVCYSDGASSGSGQTWSYLAFKRHRAVAPHLADFDLGNSEEPAAHMLLLDREQQIATVAPASEARAFLAGQWPEPEPITPEQEGLFQQELARLMEEHRNRPIDWDAINRQQREQSTRMAAMLAFLDQQVSPSRDTWPPP